MYRGNILDSLPPIHKLRFINILNWLSGVFDDSGIVPRLPQICRQSLHLLCGIRTRRHLELRRSRKPLRQIAFPKLFNHSLDVIRQIIEFVSQLRHLQRPVYHSLIELLPSQGSALSHRKCFAEKFRCKTGRQCLFDRRIDGIWFRCCPQNRNREICEMNEGIDMCFLRIFLEFLHESSGRKIWIKGAVC